MTKLDLGLLCGVCCVDRCVRHFFTFTVYLEPPSRFLRQAQG
jgi:hypothetical protein